MVLAIAAISAGLVLLLLLLGYLRWLHGAPTPLLSPSRRRVGLWPTVDVIVPIHNEVHLIAEKVRNLAALRYPEGRARILIVDGASSDGSAQIVEQTIRNNPRLDLIRTAAADKIAQLNAGLARSRGQWVMVTDADARLDSDMLRALVRVAASDDSVALVGAAVEPSQAHWLERLHWRLLNAMRQRESQRCGATVVAAPCYLFRRDCLPSFPCDVIADDVHTALALSAAGWRIGFLPVPATELRTPTNVADLVRHKLRKAVAYLREIFRFLPRLALAPSTAGDLFRWRCAQMVLMPILAAITVATSIGWLLSDPALALPALSALGGGLLLVAFYACVRGGLDVFHVLALYGLLVCILLLALLACPYARPTGCYPRLAMRPSAGTSLSTSR